MMTVHVRWPARPAEHRAGLEFSLLLSLHQGKESDNIICFFCHFLFGQKVTKKPPGNDVQPVPGPFSDLASILLW